MPQHACTRSAAPPSHFVFLPSTLRSFDAPVDQRTFLYGFSSPSKAIAVVAGTLTAGSREEARGWLQQRLGTPGDNVKILGRLQETAKDGKGKGQASAEADDGFVLRFDGQRPTLLAGEHDQTTTLVVYTPPNRHQLQFLSLVPLPLDLNSFSSASDESRMATSEAEMTEDQIFGEKLKQSRALDFSAAGSAAEGCADLEQVVKWVAHALRPAFGHS